MNQLTPVVSAPQGQRPIDEFELRERLRVLRAEIPDRPGLNPIINVAFDISRRLEAGDISLIDLRAIAGRLMDRACTGRARRLKSRIGLVDHNTTLKSFMDSIDGLMAADDAASGGAAGAGYDLFAARWKAARSGVVLTAHPTFGISEALSRHMVELASDGIDGPASGIGHAHKPDGDIDLSYEHARAQEAIHNLRSAYADLLGAFYSATHARYGERAYELAPRLFTMASWVGYDLDGRTDIPWHRSYLVRIQEKRAALTDLRERFLTLRHRLGEGPEISRVGRQITGKLDLAIAAVDEQVRALANMGPDGSSLPRIANVLTKQDGYNLTSTEPLVALLDELKPHVEGPQLQRGLATFRGLVEATGLGTGHIHLRVNAQQLNNAFRAYVHQPWTKDLSERQALSRIVEMIGTTPRETVNFASLDLETATAIRQFALIAQIQKHVDRETPIRFLIAECESAATVMIAVFFAHLFGVEDIVDISPLFETPSGLETGARLVERLLEQDAYRKYVAGRGRIAVQTGFSDAGRFIGQISATLAIERFHFQLAETVAKAGLASTEVVLFSTHGESIGRGAHPGDLSARLRYVFSDEARLRFQRNGTPLKHETSFQGGDGFMFFGNRPLTARAMATIVLDAHRVPVADDPFYHDTNFGLDFFLRLKAYQQALFAHEGYRAVLGAYGANLLYRTGSRPVKRQSETLSVHDRGDPARMRAIPNNAILQQFGYTANVVAGLGVAVGADKERFVSLAGKSARLSVLLEMIATAKRLSSLNAMGANASVFDPGFWASRASWGREDTLEPAFRLLATYLLDDERAGSINRFVHHLRLDSIDLHQIMIESGHGNVNELDESRLELDVLQAIRLALIMRVMILAAQLPRFSPQNDTDYKQLLGRALALDVPEVVAFIRQAFPHTHKGATDGSGFEEKASYRPRGIDDYGRLETEILEPMETSWQFIREIGTGISHHFGAFG
ncbi:MAG: phosphoenolpyruvate carboxylase [Hyphomicrobium aestuarii]|nr:phosphoenolpyruvate carboxylase [Hyphomicrobium aestuarii]